MSRANSKEGSDVRTRVLDAASRLIAEDGLTALTTRAVAAAAGVQAPTLYRLFGEKRGLLNAVAEHGLTLFIAQKKAAFPHPDPVQELRDAWDSYVTFGLDHPAVFAIMNEIGAPASESAAVLAGMTILHERIDRIAQEGRLRVTVRSAVALVHAAGVGTVATLLAAPEQQRDLALSSLARDAVLSRIITRTPDYDGNVGLASLAIGLRAHLDAADALTRGERMLLSELLDRLSRRGAPDANAAVVR